MGVVGSLPSPSVPSTSNDKMDIVHEELLPPKDEHFCSYTMIDEIDFNEKSPLNSNINDTNITKCYDRYRPKSPLSVTYGPINVKVRQSVAPTLATGRRSKFINLEGDAALKREIRRRRNREAAKKLKEKRINLEQKLEKEISELEHTEQDLLLVIKNLESHKEKLEAQYRDIICIQEKLSRTASSTLKHIEYDKAQINQNVPVHYDLTHIKKEPRSSSPQWQLFFSI